MSQVFFNAEVNGRAVEVMGGWDRPLRYFFLCVFGQSGRKVYSNLDARDPGAIGQDTSVFRQKLQELGITPPEGFWERIERREGNVVHRFESEGWS